MEIAPSSARSSSAEESVASVSVSGNAEEDSQLDERKRKTYTVQHQATMASFVVSQEGTRAPGSDSFWLPLEAVRFFFFLLPSAVLYHWQCVLKCHVVN